MACQGEKREFFGQLVRWPASTQAGLRNSHCLPLLVEKMKQKGEIARAFLPALRVGSRLLNSRKGSFNGKIVDNQKNAFKKNTVVQTEKS